MPSPAVLRTGLDILHYSGLTTLTRTMLRGRGSIFCLHHVCPGGGRQKGFFPNSKLEIEPAFLEAIIRHVRWRGYETLSLADAVVQLSQPKPQAKPFAVFTLDDGYKDNQTFAQPIFDKMKCPYTIFVAPGIADGTCELWWRILELVIAKQDRIEAAFENGAFAFKFNKTVQEKWATWFTLLPQFEKMDEFEQRRAIRKLAERYDVDINAYCREVAMDWDDLRKLNQDPLCTLGAHTLNHHSVGKMAAADALKELQESRNVLSRELGEDIRFNAYPYGDEPNATARDFELAQTAGYAASLTTRKGIVVSAHAKHVQALPRIMVSGRYQELRYVDAMMSGLPTILLNRLKSVNVD